MTYRADYEVENAVEDINIFESLSDEQPAAIRMGSARAVPASRPTWLVLTPLPSCYP